MLTPPFDHVAFMLTPDLPPSALKGRDDRPPPQPVITIGHAIGMTIDGDGFVWLYVEPADASLPVVRVALIHCRRACPPEVYHYDLFRRRTLAALVEQRRAEFAEAKLTADC